MVDKITKIEKDPLDKQLKNSQYILKQPGGDTLYFNSAEELAQARRAMFQSMINCKKTLLKGGFNPHSEEEKVWVETGK